MVRHGSRCFMFSKFGSQCVVSRTEEASATPGNILETNSWTLPWKLKGCTQKSVISVFTRPQMMLMYAQVWESLPGSTWKTPDYCQTTYLLLGAWRISKTSHFHQSPFLCVYCAVVYSTLSYPPIQPSFISYPQKWINTSTSLHSFSRTQSGHCWVPPVCVHMCFFSDTPIRF